MLLCNIVFVIMLFVYPNSTAMAQKSKKTIDSDAPFVAPGKFKIDIYGGYSAATGYWNKNGDIITTHKIFADTALGTADSAFSIDMTSVIFGLKGLFKVDEFLSCWLDIPLYSVSLDEKYNEETDVNRSSRLNNSYFKAMYFEIGADYTLPFFKNISLTLKTRIPTGAFKDGDFLPDNPDLCSPYFELFGGINAYYSLNKTTFELSALFNKRSHDLTDQFYGKFGITFRSVEKSELKLFVDYTKPTNKIESDEYYIPDIFPLRREALRGGIGLAMKLSDIFIPEFNYTVTLWGNNTLNTGVFILKLGFVL